MRSAIPKVGPPLKDEKDVRRAWGLGGLGFRVWA